MSPEPTQSATADSLASRCHSQIRQSPDPRGDDGGRAVVEVREHRMERRRVGGADDEDRRVDEPGRPHMAGHGREPENAHSAQGRRGQADDGKAGE